MITNSWQFQFFLFLSTFLFLQGSRSKDRSLLFSLYKLKNRFVRVLWWSRTITTSAQASSLNEKLHWLKKAIHFAQV